MVLETMPKYRIIPHSCSSFVSLPRFSYLYLSLSVLAKWRWFTFTCYVNIVTDNCMQYAVRTSGLVSDQCNKHRKHLICLSIEGPWDGYRRARSWLRMRCGCMCTSMLKKDFFLCRWHRRPLNMCTLILIRAFYFHMIYA